MEEEGSEHKTGAIIPINIEKEKEEEADALEPPTKKKKTLKSAMEGRILKTRGKGMRHIHTIPPRPSNLGIKTLPAQRVVVPKSVNWQTLEEFGIDEEVKAFDGIGWL